MSVKEKIAMWNNMATGNPNPNPNLGNKMATSDHLPKTKEPEPEKKNQNMHQSQEQKVAPKIEKTQETKKTVVNQHPPSVKAEIETKPLHQSQKPKEEPKKEEAPKPVPTHEVEGGSAMSFKLVQKMMENQTAGKGLMGFAPPMPTVTIKKVESEAGEENVGKAECEIEKDVPVVSVKERAAQLALFYEKKRKQSENQPTAPIEEKKQHPQEHKQPQEIDPPKIEEVKPQQNNCLNIPFPHNQAPIETTLPTPTQNITPPTPADPTLSLRFQNRNKKAKLQFESDED